MQKKCLPAIAFALIGTLALGCSGDDNAAVVVTDDRVVTFNDLDFNDDGFVSASEWAELDDMWDLNGDHMLDDQEFLMDDGDFGQFDQNDDALVATAEWANAFDDLDLDADGFLNSDELF